MTILAFDVSKLSLVGVLVTRRAIVQKRYEVANTCEAISLLVNSISASHPHLIVAAEPTADYHRPLVKTCLESNIPCRLINPILTKQFTRATIRGTKSDPIDALIIAKLILQGEGDLVTSALLDPVKPLIRTAHSLKQLEQTVGRIHERFAAVVPEEPELIVALKDCLKLLHTTIDQFRLSAQAQVNPNLTKLLTSIPGIGMTLATTLIAEIGTVTRFSSSSALVAYAGLDPRVKQSGTSLRRNTHITKRGSPTLRHALFLAASVARRHDPELQAYYKKKRSEGRHYREAIVATARKLTNRIYAVWKRQIPYHISTGA